MGLFGQICGLVDKDTAGGVRVEIWAISMQFANIAANSPFNAFVQVMMRVMMLRI